MTEPESTGLRTRTIAHLHCDEGTTIIVEHVYEPEGASSCDECGKPAHDPGMVGLVMSDEDDTVTALIDPGLALMLAERLQRAASLVLESGEDAADMEREAAKFAAERLESDSP